MHNFKQVEVHVLHWMFFSHRISQKSFSAFLIEKLKLAAGIYTRLQTVVT